jgi:hypothetical protein
MGLSCHWLVDRFPHYELVRNPQQPKQSNLMKILDTLQKITNSELVSVDNPLPKDKNMSLYHFVPIQLIDLVTPYNDQSTLVCLMDQMCTFTNFHDLEHLGTPGKDSFAEGALTFFFGMPWFSYVFWLPLKIPPTKWGKPSNHQESVI